MTRTGGRAATRALAATLGAAHLPLLLAPDEVSTAVVAEPPRPPRWLVRLLGARVVLQELVVLMAPTRRVVVLGAAVDGLHATSMVVAALRWPQHRRAAVTSGLVAATSSALELATVPAAGN